MFCCSTISQGRRSLFQSGGGGKAIQGRPLTVACRAGGGGLGGHDPRAQALEGAPAQLVGPNCKKKSRPRQISNVTSLQSAVADVGFTKRGGGGRTPSPKAPAV